MLLRRVNSCVPFNSGMCIWVLPIFFFVCLHVFCLSLFFGHDTVFFFFSFDVPLLYLLFSFRVLWFCKAMPS